MRGGRRRSWRRTSRRPPHIGRGQWGRNRYAGLATAVVAAAGRVPRVASPTPTADRRRGGDQLGRELLEDGDHGVRAAEVELVHQAGHFGVVRRQVLEHVHAEGCLLLGKQGGQVLVGRFAGGHTPVGGAGSAAALAVVIIVVLATCSAAVGASVVLLLVVLRSEVVLVVVVADIAGVVMGHGYVATPRRALADHAAPASRRAGSVVHGASGVQPAAAVVVVMVVDHGDLGVVLLLLLLLVVPAGSGARRSVGGPAASAPCLRTAHRIH